MPVADWSTNPNSNTNVGGVFIGEGMARADVNNAIRTVMSEFKTYLNETLDVRGFGAVGDGVTDDTTAIQAALDAATPGSRVQLGRRHKITAPLNVTKPLHIQGLSGGDSIWVSGGAPTDQDYTVRQVTANANAFNVVPGVGFPYYSGQVAAKGVTFSDMKILGPGSDAAPASGLTGRGINFDISGVGADPDIHFRQISFHNVSIRFFDRGVSLNGIAYLNHFYQCFIQDNNVNVFGSKGGASDNGGQTRFFGCQLLFARQWAFEWLDPGSTLSFFGCTISENNGGIKVHEEVQLAVFGCEIENNKGTLYAPSNPLAAGIYIPVSEVNRNSGAPKNIIGNKFIFNDVSVWIDYAGGGPTSGINFPVFMDGNQFQDPIAVKSNTALDSSAMYLGPTNTGSNNTLIADSQLVGFAGADLRLWPYNAILTRNRGVPVQIYNASPTLSPDPVLASVTVPIGATVVVTAIECYSYDVTTGARGTANLFLVDDTATERISLPLNLSANGAPPVVAQWVNSTGAARTLRVRSNAFGTGNPYTLAAYVRVQ
jgi:hypothetical protein